jgi:hypothetical protein
VRALAPEDARVKLYVLNHLADQFGARGARFKQEAAGNGLYCVPGTEVGDGELARRCRAATLDPPDAKLAEKIRTACDQRVLRVVEGETGLEPVFAPVSYDTGGVTFEVR